MDKKFKKSVMVKAGKVDLLAQAHGVGWRVTATLMSAGLTFTAYGDTIEEAEAAALQALRMF